MIINPLSIAFFYLGFIGDSPVIDLQEALLHR